MGFSSIDLAAFGFSLVIPFLIQRLKGRSRKEALEHLLNSACTVSAPGKILIAGGYLVLEKPNVGVTVSATSRFYTTVRIQQQSNSTISKSLQIKVESPQFGSEYLYSLNLENRLTPSSRQSNPFVEKCLLMTLSYVRQSLGLEAFRDLFEELIELGQLHVVLRADNDFYSQMAELDRRNLPYLSESLHRLPRFINCPRDSEGHLIIAKTGMGSSAALTTSLVGSLLQFFGVISLESESQRENDRRIVHNLAQLVHAVAQGKIGSGFDVAAAVYGSQIYQRFSDNLIPFDEIINNDPNGRLLSQVVDKNTYWDQSILPFNLPNGVEIMMGDVCGGSSSSSMAKAVLNWKKNHSEEANVIWNRLAQTNEKISRLLLELFSFSATKLAAYEDIRSAASMLRSDEWNSILCRTSDHQDVVNLLNELKLSFITCRSDLKLMGESAGTDIEPDGQSTLANATARLPGVLCSGVPGAGGVDAIFAIVLSKAARKNVEEMWSTWGLNSSENTCRVCPLMLSSDNNKFVGIQLVN